MEHYYTSLESLSARLRGREKSHAFAAGSAAELEGWQARTRRFLCGLLGLDALTPCPPFPVLLGTEELPGRPYRRHKLTIHTEADVVMPLYLLEPKQSAPGPRPAVIATHGHQSGGKDAVAGRDDIPEVARAIERGNYTYGTALAAMGFMVFCPDARGFGERRETGAQGETPDRRLASSCRALSHMALGVGLTLAGLWVWDLLRLIDYIETRPECDSGRIACVGFSGGGMQALLAAALDSRVRFAATSGYFYGYHDSLLVLNENCDCNYVPGLWNAVDMGDLGALVAPRALAVESGDSDRLSGKRGLANVTEQLETTRRAYRLLGAEHNLTHHVFAGPHRWQGDAVYARLRALLTGRHRQTACDGTVLDCRR